MAIEQRLGVTRVMLATWLAVTVAVAVSPASQSRMDAAQRSGSDPEAISHGSSFAVKGTAGRVPASRGGGYRVSVVHLDGGQPDVIFADGFESGDTSAWGPVAGLPSGTALFFDLPACPSGWTRRADAGGRAIVGSPLGGHIGVWQGAALGDLEPAVHGHTFSEAAGVSPAPQHLHWWSILWPDRRWTTYTSSNSVHQIFTWSDGLDDSGSGVYPFAAAPDTTFATSHGGGHIHALNVAGTTTLAAGNLPYLQLLMCEKD